MALSIVLADDHPIVRQAMRSLLEPAGGFTVVGEAGDGLETIRLVERLEPDVVVLDLMMPKLNGLEALRIIHKRFPKTRVVVFSMYANEAYVAEALAQGAAAYVLKGGQANNLLEAIRAVGAGRRYLSPPLSERRVEAYRKKGKSVSRGPYDLLTPRERQVLQLAAEGHTSTEIGRSLHISRRTVESHRAHLMRKLGLHSQTDLVRYALRRGIISPDE